MRFSLRSKDNASATDKRGRLRSGSQSSTSTCNTLNSDPAASRFKPPSSRDRPLPPDPPLSSASSHSASLRSTASTARLSSPSRHADSQPAPPLPKSAMATSFTRSDIAGDQARSRPPPAALVSVQNHPHIPREATATPDGMRMEVVESDGEDMSISAFKGRTKRSSISVFAPRMLESSSSSDESLASYSKVKRLPKHRPSTADSTVTSESTKSTWGTLRNKTSAKLLAFRANPAASSTEAAEISEAKAIADAYTQDTTTKALPATPPTVSVEEVTAPRASRTKPSRLRLQRPKTSEGLLGQVPRFGSPRSAVPQQLQTLRKNDMAASPAARNFDEVKSRACIATKLGPPPAGIAEGDFVARVELVLQWLADSPSVDETVDVSRRHRFSLRHGKARTSKDPETPTTQTPEVIEIELLSLEKLMESYAGDMINNGRYTKEAFDRLALSSVFQEARRRCGLASERSSFDIFCQTSENAAHSNVLSPAGQAPAQVLGSAQPTADSQRGSLDAAYLHAPHLHARSTEMMRLPSGGSGAQSVTSLTPAPRRRRRPTTAPSRSNDTPPKPFQETSRSFASPYTSTTAKQASTAIQSSTDGASATRMRSYSVLPPSAFARVAGSLPSSDSSAEHNHLAYQSPLSGGVYETEKRGSFSSFRSQGTCSTNMSMTSASTGPTSNAPSTVSIQSGQTSPTTPFGAQAPGPISQQQPQQPSHHFYHRFGGLPSPAIVSLVGYSDGGIAIDPKTLECDAYRDTITTRELRRQASGLRLEHFG